MSVEVVLKEELARLLAGSIGLRLLSDRPCLRKEGSTPVIPSALGMSLIGEVVWGKVATVNPQAIGGVALRGDSIAFAAAMHAAFVGEGAPDVFVVRWERKDYGTRKSIEGPPLHSGARVVLVDSVVNTGEALVMAIHRVKETGAVALKAVPLIDCRKGGKGAVEALGVEYDPVFAWDELEEMTESGASLQGRP